MGTLRSNWVPPGCYWDWGKRDLVQKWGEDRFLFPLPFLLLKVDDTEREMQEQRSCLCFGDVIDKLSALIRSWKSVRCYSKCITACTSSCQGVCLIGGLQQQSFHNASEHDPKGHRHSVYIQWQSAIDSQALQGCCPKRFSWVQELQPSPGFQWLLLAGAYSYGHW